MNMFEIMSVAVLAGMTGVFLLLIGILAVGVWNMIQDRRKDAC